MGEEWRPIPGRDGYEVSSEGVLRRKKKSGEYRAIATSATPKGYRRASVAGKNCLVHRLVLLAFRGPPAPGMEAAHLNGRPFDNRIENLEWTTRKANHAHKIQHGTAQRGEKNPRARLKEDDVRRIREPDADLPALAREFGVAYATVWSARVGQRWIYLEPARRALEEG
jgi:hypothetical protein